MKTLLKYSFFLSLIVLLAACGDDEEVVQITEQQAATQALSMTSGTVTSTDPDTTAAGQVYYDVDVVTSEGAVIEFEYWQSDGSLKEIRGESGPFTYEVNPGLGLMLFSAARELALNTQPGQVSRWDLERDTSSNVWTYTFEINTDNDSFEVRINAENGTVISG